MPFKVLNFLKDCQGSEEGPLLLTERRGRNQDNTETMETDTQNGLSSRKQEPHYIYTR